MSLFNYVHAPNSNLVCCICRVPFTNPVTTRTCTHTFCRDCILRAIDHCAQCPVDRSPLTADSLAPADPIIRSLVEELEVECVHREEGCMHTCQRQFLPTHLLDTCVYREVVCPRGKCGAVMLYKDLTSHRHEGEKDDTTETETSTLASCDAQPEQKEADEPTMPPALTSDSRFAALAEQNILLRKRVESLESLLGMFKREMSAVKVALGPWFRANEGSRMAGGYQATEVPSGIHHLSASTSNMVHRDLGSPAGADSPQQYMFPYTPPSADSLAAYFPSEVEDYPPRRPGGGGGRTHRMMGSHDMHGYGSAVPVTPLVAPLNLNTTLEGTLDGLRESIVGLAASVDSMGRRHEIALTTETMRMGEEIGGLRAGVHGLRMQVHTIMMDRNAQVSGHGHRREGEEGLGNGIAPWVSMPSPTTRMYYPQPPSITKL